MADTRLSLLNVMLQTVAFDGWNDSSFIHAAQTLGINKEEAYRLFPAGTEGVVSLFIAQADALMEQEMSKPEIQSLKIPQKIRHAILWRLDYFAPHREAMRRTISFYSLPMNAAQGLKTLYHTVDTIWHAAGDTALDFSFYTKRATLAMLYSSTLLVWLDDTSENHAETIGFLDRRLDNIRAFGKLKYDLKKRFC